ncbi:MAG TPA: hypothetical protein VMU55_06235, partial [Solirubrobacteraceae bacterium]|nr:hypothetical protein [Solirubrobacteraceae bacterium]
QPEDRGVRRGVPDKHWLPVHDPILATVPAEDTGGATPSRAGLVLERVPPTEGGRESHESSLSRTVTAANT